MQNFHSPLVFAFLETKVSVSSGTEAFQKVGILSFLKCDFFFVLCCGYINRIKAGVCPGLTVRVRFRAAVTPPCSVPMRTGRKRKTKDCFNFRKGQRDTVGRLLGEESVQRIIF